MAQTEAKVKMIQVHLPTHERLAALKLPGLTFEDVINFALDHLTPDEIADHYAAWQREAMARLQGAARPLDGTFSTHDAKRTNAGAALAEGDSSTQAPRPARDSEG